MRITVTVPDTELEHDLRTGLGAASPLPDDVELVVWDMTSDAPAPKLDIVVPPYMTMGSVLGRLDGVEVGVIQGQSIGFDGVAKRMPPGHRFANAASVHETATAELALTLTLAAQRELPHFVDSGARGAWEPEWSPGLADRRVLVLGYGGVGAAIAARLAPFEAEVRVVARTARVEGGIRVHAIDELPALLPDTEVLIVALPGGRETYRTVDAAMLAALPDGALVVNVGRGTIVDTDALVAELAAGRLRAALDVTDPEPLPEDHPLWHLALVTPHVGGASAAMRPRAAALVRRQIDRALAGEPPLNIVLES